MSDIIPHDRHTASAAMRFGKFMEMEAKVDIGTTGLLAVAALTSAILLSTSILVGTAIRENGRARELRRID
ncbi:MAG: hypothetical protein ABW184_06080 [Sphingobium sp.]